MTEAVATSRRPVSTYRLQVTPDFGFDQAAEQVGYLADLGVTHLYLSPILAPVPGSQHGYDVVDHTRLNPDAGGRPGFDRLVAAAHETGLGVIADVVPNHMAVPTPERLNARLWDVLRDGPGSDAARWFDVDWAAGGDRLVLPVLGSRLPECLAAGELATAIEDGEAVVRYYDHRFPVRPGTEELALPELLEAQHYRLVHWRDADEQLNYRRFFDVSTLIAIRVEDREVFDDSHRLLADLVREGALDGLRIDHPDGLADPQGYLDALAGATGGTYVVIEKILEGDESLGSDWRCAGTTGYDTLNRLNGLFVHAAGAHALEDLYRRYTGEASSAEEIVEAAKREAAEHVLVPEVRRLTRLGASLLPRRSPLELRTALLALLAGMDRYRAYRRPGEEMAASQRGVLARAAGHARDALADDRGAVACLDDLTALAAGHANIGADPVVAEEFATRFAQTCGPVLAKGIEDTAFYRYLALPGSNEVGGDPAHPVVRPEELDAFATALSHRHPATMTTLSTHDTKRSEDVRARLAVLAELPQEWEEAVERLRGWADGVRGPRVDPSTEYLIWQTLYGAWPIDADRIGAYVRKAVREAKVHTSWTDPDDDYETQVVGLATAAATDEVVGQVLGRLVARTASAARAATLGQKLLQLVLPGVADVYQGCELVDLSLVDPDNRRPVDFGARATRLARLTAGAAPADLHDEKLFVTSTALRLRAERPEWFIGDDSTYAMLESDTPHAVAVARGDAGSVEIVAVVTRHADVLRREGGFGPGSLALPAGQWIDTLSGRGIRSDGRVRLALLLAELPVALLVRDEVSQAGSGLDDTRGSREESAA